MVLGENECRVKVGRVVEVRIRRLVDLEELHVLTTEVRAAIERAGPQTVICTDCRSAVPMRGSVARVWSRAMRDANRRIARSAFLVDPGNTLFNLQLERVIRCAIHPARRCFAELAQVHAWVGDVLSDAERQGVQGLFSDERETG
jgi:hypothetical protein